MAGVVPPLGQRVVRLRIARESRPAQRRRRRQWARLAAALTVAAHAPRAATQQQRQQSAGQPSATHAGVPDRSHRPQPRRRPPVPVAEQPHRRRHQQRAHQRRVQQHRDRRAQAERFDQHDVGRDERQADQHHDRRRAGDDPARSAPARARRWSALSAPSQVRLLDAREQEDLVVHRQPEQHAEHDDRQRRLDEAERLEVQQHRRRRPPGR